MLIRSCAGSSSRSGSGGGFEVVVVVAAVEIAVIVVVIVIVVVVGAVRVYSCSRGVCWGTHALICVVILWFSEMGSLS